MIEVPQYMNVPQQMKVAEFLDWTPPSPFEKHRWHLLDGLPVMMQVLPAEQAILHSQTAYVISAYLHHAGSDARSGVKVGVVPEGSDHSLYVACIGVTHAPARDTRLMEDPVLLVEIANDGNSELVGIGVPVCKLVPSVQEIIVLHGNSVCAALHRRNETGGWDDPEYLFAEDFLDLRSVGITVPVERLYRSVDLGRRSLASRAINPPHPGRTIQRECLDPLGMSVADAAAHLGVQRVYLSDVVAGVDRISADLALPLALAWGLCARSWLDMQSDHDLAQIDGHDDSIEVGRLRPPTGHWVDLAARDQPQDWRWCRDPSLPGVHRDEAPDAGLVTYLGLVTGDEGAWRVVIPDLPGWAVEAPTVAAALRLAARCAAEWIRLQHEAGRPTPPPGDADELVQVPETALALSLDDGTEVRRVRVRVPCAEAED